MRDTAVIMYTHSDYSDVWPLFFGQFEELFPFKDIPKYVFVDDKATEVEILDDSDCKPDGIPDGWEVIYYDDTEVYANRFASCLEQVPQKYVLLHHEDMPLYFPPDKKTLGNLPEYLEKTGKPFVKFTRALETLENIESPLPQEDRKIWNISPQSSWLFSVQVALWNREILLDIYQNAGGMNIWEFETAAQMYLKDQEIYGNVWYDNETLRGLYHYDCKLYPHIATAVHKGKWVTNEYHELNILLPKYGIDPSVRGEHQ